MKHLLLLTILSFSYISHSQSWEDVAGLPDGSSVRHHPVTFSIGGVGYLVAGARPAIGTLKDFYSYDAAADEWTTLPDFPGLQRGFSYGVTTDIKGYVGFGYYENDDASEGFALNDLWEYDPVSATWTELASCPCVPRYHPAMVQVNDKIYVGLGANDFGDLGDWWEYDIATDTWSEKTDFPASVRHHPYYFGIDDYVYVGFGHHAADIFNDFYRYDPSSDSWLALNDFPDQGRVAGTQFSYDGKGYILSGQGETHSNLPTGEFWEYDVDADAWTELMAHPGGGRWAPGSFLIDDKVFFTCGEAFTGEKNDLMVFDLSELAGIEESEVVTAPLISPNPSNGWITIPQTFQKASVFDASGRLVLKADLTSPTLDLSTLGAGMYVVQLENETGFFTEKLIIE